MDVWMTLIIAKKLVCVGVDGASVIQGHKNSLCIKLQTSCSPYMTAIHCMDHKMNLSFKIVSKYLVVTNVEDLIIELYSYFCRSPKWFLEFQNFADGITDGNKLLKDVDTRWISLHGPVHWVYLEHRSLIGVMYEHCYMVDKAPDLFRILCDIETTLTLVGLLRMLEEMNHLVKKTQERAMYIVDYAKIRKMTCMALDNLYHSKQTFVDLKFAS